ncbi:MAG: hypothetical protein HKL92_05935 [Candidatus Eremiobacteraeota bacterium]|nr:hypothetical protein [Candidatus Eremiobacteraeota bacterium]NNM92866.1 hypothetical protein [Candidatus Eremiobacteraeota bacterium]
MKLRARLLASLSAAGLCASLAATGLAHGKTAAGASPPPNDLKLPVIIHVIARPLCSGLHRAIGPAIGLMLQNNAIIAKSQPLFNDYVRYNIEGSAGKAARQLAQVKMEYLVGPLVKNTAKIDKILADPAVFNDGAGTDSRNLNQMKAKLLKALTVQKMALDLINGFVSTRQLADLQHSGFEYLNAINGTQEIVSNPSATPTPNPNFYNENYAGLAPQNLGPGTMNLNNLPGLSIGYNPIKAVATAMHWVRKDMVQQQNAAAPQIIAAAHICTGGLPQKTP